MNSSENFPTSPGTTDELLARLGHYVALESPSGDSEAIGRMVHEVVARLVSLGATATTIEAATGDHVVCRFAGTPGHESEKPLLLLLHTDTVWQRGRIDEMPWRIDGGIARGPGVYDMKGGIIVVEEAIRCTTGRRDRPVVVVLVADEEVGSPTARSLIEAEAAGAHAVLGFEPPHPDGALKTSRWGSTRLAIAVRGREAHAALDAASGVSAIDELVDLLVRVRGLVAHDGVLCNIGTISGGTRTNVVAGHATAEIGLRFRDEALESRVLAELGALAPQRDGASVLVTELSNRPAWQAADMHDALLARIARIAEPLGYPVHGRAATGAADTNLTGRLGVPSVDGLGPLGQGAHASDEQILVSSLAERIDLLSALLVDL